MGRNAQRRRAARASRRGAPGTADQRVSVETVTDHGLCLGVEIEHEDGVVECSTGTACPGGPHPVGLTVSCGLARRMGRYTVLHSCAECSA